MNGIDIPDIDTMIDWSVKTVQFLKDFHTQNQNWIDTFASYPSGHLGLVGQKDGAFELYDGRLRAIDATGNVTLNDVPDYQYHKYITEDVEPWTYMKFPYLINRGKEEGWNRVGPLARMNICDYISTPLAEKERQEFVAYTNGQPNNMSMHTHLARLIEILYCAERMKELLHDEDIMGSELVRKGTMREEGIGIIEAPRGTLTHHYKIDDQGKITKCNLIVSTTHNNEPMNKAVSWVAQNVLDSKKEITETMLNQVEIAIRAYDPCLSCATHALGTMPMHAKIVDHEGKVIDEKFRS